MNAEKTPLAFSSGLVPIRRALVSVSNKQEVDRLCRRLHAFGVQIVSTGGTAAFLHDRDIPVTDVSEVTGFPEMMGGRLKTIHPKIHGGILGQRGIDDDVMAIHDIGPIDLVVVNLYPFREVVATGASVEECNEKIDIGGPAGIRSAAKNDKDVAVVVSPSFYGRLLHQIAEYNGHTTRTFRKRLKAAAFAYTAAYDASVSEWCSFHAVLSTED